MGRSGAVGLSECTGLDEKIGTGYHFVNILYPFAVDRMDGFDYFQTPWPVGPPGPTSPDAQRPCGPGLIWRNQRNSLGKESGMAIELELEGKSAAVTGGSVGIGKAIAFKLAAEGVSVAICGRREEVLERAADDIRARTGSMVLAVRADVTVPGAVEAFIQKTVDAFGRLDVLINNVGASSAQSFESVTDQIWRYDLELKLFSAIRASRAAIPHMRSAGGGRIINITTPGGKAPVQASVPTSVSRAAGIALTKAMSKDYVRENILVNTVCVGAIKSGQWVRRWKSEGERGSIEEFYRQCGKAVPVGRMGEAEEVADVVAFLVSARGSYITGTAINVDGGESATV